MKKQKIKETGGIILAIVLALVAFLFTIFTKVFKYAIVWSIIKVAFWPIVIFISVILVTSIAVIIIGKKK